MGSSIGVIIGVIVLLVSIGFVVLMMVSEWSASGEVSEAEGEAVVQAPPPARASSRRVRAVPAKRQAAPKKKAARKSKKK